MPALLSFCSVSGAAPAAAAPSASPGDPFAINQGAALVSNLIDCGGCHTADPSKPFGGGNKFPIDGAGHYVYSRNLTSDPATGCKLTEDQFIKVMQTGEDFTNHGPGPRRDAVAELPLDDRRRHQGALRLPARCCLRRATRSRPTTRARRRQQGPVPLPTQYNEGEETRPLPPRRPPTRSALPARRTAAPDPGNAVLGRRHPAARVREDAQLLQADRRRSRRRSVAARTS